MNPMLDNNRERKLVFVVDDDEAIREYLAKVLHLKGFEVECAQSGEQALARLENGLTPVVMILDLKLPGIPGVSVLKEAKRLHQRLPVIILTAHGATRSIVEAVRLGASDYIIKPFGANELEVSINNVLEKKDLIEEISRLREQVDGSFEDEMFITASEEMNRIKETIKQVSNTDATILLQGESGVGKEVLSHYIHHHSPRRDKPFLKINCAALPGELLESELFGYEKGAFTGAYRMKPGKFELAYGGTILMDEIGDMSLELQAKLLQVLQDNSFTRLGGQKDIKVDVRIIASTNKNLEESIRDGSFRADLYYRLNVIDIYIPPLRKRKEEIEVLCDYFLKKYRKKYNNEVQPISKKLMESFKKYDWPGNIRELENIIKRLVILGDESSIRAEIYKRMSRPAAPTDEEFESKGGRIDLKKIKKRAALDAEREIILSVLQQTNWNQTRAAHILSISYKALLYKMKHCGIKSQRAEPSAAE